MPSQESQPTYAVVQKISKPQQSGSAESLDQLRIPTMSGDDDDDEASENELPPPLPSRLPNLEDTMKRTEPSENVFQFDNVEKPEEKTKKAGFKLFKKKHRRQLSDGNVVAKTNDNEKGDFPSSGEEKSKFHHRRSKSQADVMKVVENGQDSLMSAGTQEMYTEITIPANKASSSDEVPPVKPYLEVDITEPPHTPTVIKKENKSMGGGSEDENAPYELPEGWREVKADGGTYYWHVASGTTQWTLPQVATRPKVCNAPCALCSFFFSFKVSSYRLYIAIKEYYIE